MCASVDDAIPLQVVIVLFLNLVLGIIIDAFSQLRHQSNQRHAFFSTRCFVCGCTRTQLEDSRRSKQLAHAAWYPWAPGCGEFDRHIHLEHNVWNYLFFTEHLTRKPPTEHNGIESSVARRLGVGDLSWVPSGDCLILQQWGRRGD